MVIRITIRIVSYSTCIQAYYVNILCDFIHGDCFHCLLVNLPVADEFKMFMLLKMHTKIVVARYNTLIHAVKDAFDFWLI